MKTIIFALILAYPTSSFAKTITLTIPDDDIKIVETDVVDAEQWIKDAWAGKVNNCKKRMVRGEMDRSVQNGESIPAGEDAIVKKAFARPDYKTRKQRDVEELAKARKRATDGVPLSNQ